MNPPKIKKKLSSFLFGEDGRIGKASLLKLGIVVTAFSATSLDVDAKCGSKGDYHQNNCFHANCPGIDEVAGESVPWDEDAPNVFDFPCADAHASTAHGSGHDNYEIFSCTHANAPADHGNCDLPFAYHDNSISLSSDENQKILASHVNQLSHANSDAGHGNGEQKCC